MKPLRTGFIRNFLLSAHVDAGKTTTTERMLFYAGVTRSIGDVDKGNTVTDFLPMERERGITIASAAISFEWKGHHVNLVDTPGHVDFQCEVERSMRVVDGAVVIFDAVAGVEAQTETVWRQANRYNVPRIAFVNKYDREGASLERTMAMMRDRLAANPLALQWPIGEGFGFRGVVDLLRLERLEWSSDTGSKIKVEKLGASELGPFAERRRQLLESVCEVDDKFLELYMERDETVTETDLPLVHQAIRRATISMRALPVFCGAAFRNKGVQPVMDGVIAYLPSPLDSKLQEATMKNGEKVTLLPDDKASLVCLAWKVVHDPHMGLLTYFRVIQGTLKAGMTLVNASRADLPKERPRKIVQLQASDLIQVQSMSTGDIGALVGLQHVSTGDTLVGGTPVVLRGISVPTPVFFRSIEAASLADTKKLDDSLALLHKEDPSFQISVDRNTGQTLVGGMGELHLEYIIDRLFTHYKVVGNVGSITTAYRWAPDSPFRTTLEAEHLFETNSGKRIFGALKLEVWSRDDLSADQHNESVEESLLVQSSISTRDAQPLDRRALEAVKEGVLSACLCGHHFGHPVARIGVNMLSYQLDTEGSGVEATALKVCAEKILRGVFETSPLALFEPAMRVEVRAEGEAFGAIVSDFVSGRRGEVLTVSQDGREKHAVALVPLKEMMGYAQPFRELTQGKGSYTMEFVTFSKVKGVH